MTRGWHSRPIGGRSAVWTELALRHLAEKGALNEAGGGAV
jgi:hypothetical protein